MRFRNYHRNSRPVQHETTKVGDERMVPLKLVVIHHFVTLKPFDTTNAYPTAKPNPTENHSTSLIWNKGSQTTAVTETDRKVTHTQRVSSNAARMVLTANKAVKNYEDTSVWENTNTPVRHHHHYEPDLDDEILQRTIKISMPVTFKDPIPTLLSKKTYNHTKVNDEKSGRDNTKPTSKSVFLKIVAGNYTVTLLSPEQTQEVMRAEAKKKAEESARIAFEKRMEIALSTVRARSAQRRLMASKQDANKQNTTILTIATKITGKPKNTTFLIT